MPDLPALTTELYRLLEPHEPDVRDRAIRAVMVMLGAVPQVAVSPSPELPDDDHDGPPLAPKVKSWMRANGITREQISRVFHIEGGAPEVLPPEAPGKNGKEKTINAYVLAGIAAFLQTAETRFDDRTARDVCRAMGCFNEGNHAYYLKGKGNVLGGTKDSGWMLTGPGLKLGAELIKKLAGEE
ncbi:hypothetical protein JJC00_26380 [Bradyrhizobium diazoefficiens]|uniref:hypothetical protein n=1 Tax=Bradyrhizobium diazoefficiens TaxID=1355477 RepID=UPI00190B3EC0|nr:hypothetical protein [Bradyrhizobium diazoefficiens]QQO32100.1 hypothetical protein JJC00_26380 [Bradyrhizobium diazoefficiens]